MNETITISKEEYADLIRASCFADQLIKVLSEKVNAYGGIKHEELKLICTVLCISDGTERI